MSTVTRIKAARRSRSRSRLVASPLHRDEVIEQKPVHTKVLRHAFEAPEEAVRPRERPESGRASSASLEAPDSGEGRCGYLEHEFTHGRSWS
jgi:hypothetical protein